MKNRIPTLLVAQRQALGLSFSELASLPEIKQNQRVIANYERGDRTPASSYVVALDGLTMQYKILLGLINQDLANVKDSISLSAFKSADKAAASPKLRDGIAKARPASALKEFGLNFLPDDKDSQKMILPYFRDFADFAAYRKSNRPDDITFWRIWQAVVGHLSLTERSLHIVDAEPVPEYFASARLWLFGARESI